MNKHRTLAFNVMALALALLVGSSLGQTQRSPFVSIEYVLRNQLTRTVSGISLHFKSVKGSTVLHTEATPELAIVAKPYFISEIVTSENQKFIILKINKLSKSELGADYDFAYLVSKVDNHLVCKAILKQSSLPRGQWIVEFGGISNDGLNVLVKMGAGSVPFEFNGRSTSGNEWQTWDTEKGKLLSRGLVVPDRESKPSR